MIKKLICMLWGHKTIHKAYTGETMQQSNGLGMEVTAALYTFHRTEFCTRCGKTVHSSSNAGNQGQLPQGESHE